MKVIAKENFSFRGTPVKKGDVVEMEESSIEIAEKKGLIEKTEERKVEKTVMQTKEMKPVKNRMIKPAKGKK